MGGGAEERGLTASGNCTAFPGPAPQIRVYSSSIWQLGRSKDQRRSKDRPNCHPPRFSSSLRPPCAFQDWTDCTALRSHQPARMSSKQSKAEALARLAAARRTGVRAVSESDFVEQKIFDEVDESRYREIVAERRRSRNFIAGKGAPALSHVATSGWGEEGGTAGSDSKARASLRFRRAAAQPSTSLSAPFDSHTRPPPPTFLRRPRLRRQW